MHVLQQQRRTAHFGALAIIVTCLVTLVGLCVAGSASAAAPKPVKAWTVLVYIDGDNNLEKYVTLDIERELSAPGSNADVNVVCIADRIAGYDRAAGDWTGTKLFYCRPGMTATPANAIADWGERNMGDPRTLAEFVAWAKVNYPARNYALFFWDHGWMWRPGCTLRDDTSGDGMNEDEFITAMTSPGAGPVQLVGWDMCERQTVEVATTWRGLGAQAVVGSEEDTWWEGQQYDLFIADLQAKPTATAQELAVLAAAKPGGDRTSSALALDTRFDAVLAAVDRFAAALTTGLPAHRAEYVAAAKWTQYYGDTDNRDLYDLANEVKATTTDPAIADSAQAVMDAVAADVLFNWFLSQTYGDSHGVSIWWPQTAAARTYSNNGLDHWGYYRTLKFSQQTRWDEFLAAYAK